MGARTATWTYDWRHRPQRGTYALRCDVMYCVALVLPFWSFELARACNSAEIVCDSRGVGCTTMSLVRLGIEVVDMLSHVCQPEIVVMG